MAILRQIAAQVAQHRRAYDERGFLGRINHGKGIRALFAGESGTGKTIAAHVIVVGLRHNLYRVDLLQVVNKCIGDTEKHPERSSTRTSTLFGRRDVRSANDRYVNVEISYPPQRIENFEGIFIVATNLERALDHAFLRRHWWVADACRVVKNLSTCQAWS